MLSFHHLIPRTCHSNKWFKKNFSKDEMKKRGIYLCRACHTFIHRSFTEKELGREFNTLNKLLGEARFIKFISWVKRQR